MPTGKFAWARVEPGSGSPIASVSVDDLVTQLRKDGSTDGISIALGFESPLFLPVPADSGSLSRGRCGEGNRSMFAPAGAAVTTLGVHEAAWILRAIHDHLRPVLEYSLDWGAWPPQDETRRLLLWEAFISGAAHGDTHERDAATAADFFRANEHNLNRMNAVRTDQPLSLVHAAALWAGWANDLERLHQPCLVLKPEKLYEGSIDPA